MRGTEAPYLKALEELDAATPVLVSLDWDPSKVKLAGETNTSF